MTEASAPATMAGAGECTVPLPHSEPFVCRIDAFYPHARSRLTNPEVRPADQRRATSIPPLPAILKP